MSVPDGFESSFKPEEPEGRTRLWRLRSLSEATPRRTGWLVRGVPLRYLTLLASVGGVGKSHYAIGIASDGSVAGEPWDTIYVSFEDGAEEVLRPRIEAAGGDATRIHELVVADADSLASFELPRDLDELQHLIREVRARLIVIDPIVASFDTKLDAYKDQHVRQVLARLWQIAREEDCAVVMVGHLNRAPSQEAYLRIANSMAFWNAARSVVLITPEGEEDDGLRLVAQRKANLARLAPIERHVLEEVVLPDMLDPETGEPLVSSRLRFVEIADDVNAADLLAPSAPTETETAEALLGAILADGEWHESSPVKELMEAAGFSERTTKRAAQDLNYEYRSEGFPAKTSWRLPVGPVLRSKSGPTVDLAELSQKDHPEPPVGPTDYSTGAGPTENGSEPRPLIGEEGYLSMLVDAHEAGLITTDERDRGWNAHRLVVLASGRAATPSQDVLDGRPEGWLEDGELPF